MPIIYISWVWNDTNIKLLNEEWTRDVFIQGPASFKSVLFLFWNMTLSSLRSSVKIQRHHVCESLTINNQWQKKKTTCWKNGLAEEEEEEEEKEEVTNALVPNASYDVATHNSSRRGCSQKLKNYISDFCHQQITIGTSLKWLIHEKKHIVIINHVENVC